MNHTFSRAKASLCVLLCLLMTLTLSACSPRYEPPVIQGVQPQLTVEEGGDLTAQLLQGVTGAGGQDRPDAVFEVTVAVYDENNNQVTTFTPGTYRAVYHCDDGTGNDTYAETPLTITPADTQPPVISGAKDLETTVGSTVSYREGIIVTDNKDASVPLQVDASQVNLAEPGLYPVTYSATDKAGNRAEAAIIVTVMEAEEPQKASKPLPPMPEVVTQEMVDELCDSILAKIVTNDMTLREKAYKVYKYVYNNIKYVGSSDKSSWLRGAYSGFVYDRGDCYNYFACSKALLTRLGIPTVDLQRVGGTSRHYWQLVNVGDGWYHFDACWHPTGYHVESFMLTEAEARAQTERVSAVRKNYYVYDYASCPVEVVGTPVEESPVVPENPVEPETPVTEPDVPVTEPEVPSVETGEPVTEPEVPSVETEEPVTEPEVPSVETEEPVTEPEVPSVETEEPVTEPEVPSAETEEPVPEPETPSVETEEPVTEPEVSDLETEEPSPESAPAESPAEDTETPASEADPTLQGEE